MSFQQENDQSSISENGKYEQIVNFSVELNLYLLYTKHV